MKLNSERIGAARVAKGWTRDDLARAIKVSPATISRLERGISLRPGTLYSACRELGITVESVIVCTSAGKEAGKMTNTS